MRDVSLILRTDGYKPSHWPLYPDGTQFVFSYLESRGGKFPETVFTPMFNYIACEYLQRPVTMKDVEYAEQRFAKYFGGNQPFNRAGWEHVVKDHKGILPLRIRMAPEGMVIPTRNVLMTVENTCPKCAWVTNYVEPLLMQMWYPITVATLSREIKKLILDYLVKSGDPAGLPFKLHDFGYRGVSSQESAAIGGAAHLVNFSGSDTVIALEFISRYYNEEFAAFSIPATEHSIMTARGEDGEVEQMKRFLEVYGDGPYPAIACVSDTYNLWRACREYWGGQLKQQVEALNNKVLVVRPDSGDPPIVVRQTLETLDAAFGHTVNEKGYKVLNHVRVIQGDGVNYDSINAILKEITTQKYSADNVAFGMGGALLQQVNRDTQRFALKASSYIINGVQHDYQKNPVTDPGKRSKAGRLKLVFENGVYSTVPLTEPGKDILQTVYENGNLLIEPTFKEVRERAALEVPEYESATA